MASLARVSRSGFTSGVDMLREVSTAKMMSLPRRLTTSQRYPTSGPASATNKEGQRRQQQCALHAAPPDGYRLSELHAQVRRHEARQRGVLAGIINAPQPEQAEAGDEPAGQPSGMAERHGNLRKRVCCSSKPKHSRATAGISAQE